MKFLKCLANFHNLSTLFSLLQFSGTSTVIDMLEMRALSEYKNCITFEQQQQQQQQQR